jgi:hypothetical protein
MVSEGADLSLDWLPQVAYAAVLLVPERQDLHCYIDTHTHTHTHTHSAKFLAGKSNLPKSKLGTRALWS